MSARSQDACSSWLAGPSSWNGPPARLMFYSLEASVRTLLKRRIFAPTRPPWARAVEENGVKLGVGHILNVLNVRAIVVDSVISDGFHFWAI